MTDVAGHERQPRSGGRLALLAAAAVLTALFVWFFVIRPAPSQGRAEAEHSMWLPASTTELQVLGNASHIVLGSLGLDRGASTIFVIDRGELDDFLGQLTWDSVGEPEIVSPGSASLIPGNSVYQPSSTPWSSDTEPEQVLYSEQTPGDADFIVIELYPLPDTNLDTNRVGVWMYSDWN